jgi:hypothetical protein
MEALPLNVPSVDVASSAKFRQRIFDLKCSEKGFLIFALKNRIVN